jgi:hypothetical protein
MKTALALAAMLATADCLHTAPVVDDSTTVLSPQIVSGKPVVPSQIWLDPGKKLDKVRWESGDLKWTTHDAQPGEPFVTYEVTVNEKVVAFIEQSPLRR